MTTIGTCTLRLARPRDARPLARMSRDYIEQGLTWRWREANLKQKINAQETVVLVAELEVGGVQFIGGFAAMDFQLDKAQLLLLAVHPNLRRRNIGGQLIRWLHKSARVAGAEHIELQVRADNYSARRFYQKQHYMEETLIPGYYDGKQAAYQMKLHLRDA
jgi:ribosomal-protein-alanine N-acetyltransferase